jgi:hypothetical protein
VERSIDRGAIEGMKHSGGKCGLSFGHKRRWLKRWNAIALSRVGLQMGAKTIVCGIEQQLGS